MLARGALFGLHNHVLAERAAQVRNQVVFAKLALSLKESLDVDSMVKVEWRVIQDVLVQIHPTESHAEWAALVKGLGDRNTWVAVNTRLRFGAVL